MSEPTSDRISRVEARRRRREQRRLSLDQDEEDKAVNGMADPSGGSELDGEKRSRSSTDNEAELSRTLAQEEKRRERREKRRQREEADSLKGESRAAPVVTDFSKREIRERRPSDPEVLSADTESAGDADKENGQESEQKGHEYNPVKKKGYRSYASRLRKTSHSGDVDKRKERYAAAIEGYQIEDSADFDDDFPSHDSRDQAPEVKSTVPVKHLKETYLMSASGKEREVPHPEEHPMPHHLAKQWPPLPHTDDDEDDDEIATTTQKGVVKTFEEHEPIDEDKGVDDAHVDSVKSLKEQWQRPKDTSKPLGVNKPKVPVKRDDGWITHFKPVIDEGETPQEPEWLKMVRARRWKSTVQARFPQDEQEKQAFEKRSTTPRKFKKPNPYTLMRSKSDLDDEFEAVMRRRRRTTDDQDSIEASKRSWASLSEADSESVTVLNKVPIQGPLKEYQKNLALERARTTMLKWTFSTDLVDDPYRFDLPKPIDLTTQEEYDREQEWKFSQARRQFTGGSESEGMQSPSIQSASRISLASVSDEESPKSPISSTPAEREQRHSIGSDRSTSPRDSRSMSVDSGSFKYREAVPFNSTMADDNVDYIPKVENIKQKYKEKEKESIPKSMSLDEEIQMIPRMKEIKNKYLAPKEDTPKPKQPEFDQEERFEKLSDIRSKLVEKGKDSQVKVLSKPKLKKKLSTDDDIKAFMASRRQITDESVSESPGTVQEIKSLASDITKTFGSEEGNSKKEVVEENKKPKREKKIKELNASESEENGIASEEGDTQQYGPCGKPEGCGTDDELDKFLWKELEVLPTVEAEANEEPDIVTDKGKGAIKAMESASLESVPQRDSLIEDDESIRNDGGHSKRESVEEVETSAKESDTETEGEVDSQQEKPMDKVKSDNEFSEDDGELLSSETDDDEMEVQKEKEDKVDGNVKSTLSSERPQSYTSEDIHEKSEDDGELLSSETDDDEKEKQKEKEDKVDGNVKSTLSPERPQSYTFEDIRKKKLKQETERPRSYAFGEEEQWEDPSITSNLKAFSDHRRKLKPARRHAASSNPVRQRQNREDLRDETDILRIREEQEKPSLAGKKKKEKAFADEALAGLSSTEDLAAASTALRKTAKDSSGVSKEIKDFGGFLPVMLIQIKGSRHMQTRLVEPSVKSLNSGDVFVLVTPKMIHLWNGRDANVMKKAKGMEVSTIIVKQKDLGCNASKVHILDQDKETSDGQAKSFWKTLGGKADVADSSDFPTDEEHEKGLTQTNLVYRVNCTSDPPELVLREDLCGRVLSEKFMDNAQAYVIDFGSEVYLWLGRNCPNLARTKGVALAQDIFKGKFTYQSSVNPLDPKTKVDGTAKKRQEKRPSWALFGRMTARSETVLFREKFIDWPDHNVDYTQDFVKQPVSGSFSNLAEKRPNSIFEMQPCDPADLIEAPSEPSLILEGFDVGRGTGSIDEEGIKFIVSSISLKIWHVKEYSYQLLPEEEYGHFFSSEGYVVRWKYCVKRTGVRTLKGQQSKYEDVGRDKVAYFFWQGHDCTLNEKGTAALMTVELDSDKGPQVLVSQGKEPPCFTRLFEGKMVVHLGKRESLGETDEVALFIARSEEPQEAYLLQIPASPSSLRSRTSFVVADTKKGVLYAWHGYKSQSAAKKLAVNAAKRLKKWFLKNYSKDFKAKEVSEGDETKDFWNILGGKGKHLSLSDASKKYDFTLRVFHLKSSSGSFEASEVLNPGRSEDICPYPILQSQLYSAAQPALFLVDAVYEIYLWQGWWPQSDEDAESRASTTGYAETRLSNDRRLAMETAKSYAEELKRDFSQAFIVFAGLEPKSFKNLFPFWEDRTDVAKINRATGRSDGEMLKLETELAKLSRKVYSLEELKERPLPEGVDPTKLETYLSDKDFEKAFQMSRSSFDGLPRWKKTNLRKKAGLF